jgi:hypothetical protein
VPRWGDLRCRGNRQRLRTGSVAGTFCGASAMARLPTEIALTEQTRKFKASSFQPASRIREVPMARAHASSVINAPVEEVWARIRDFNALAIWHPAVAKSTIEGGAPSDQVGCVRVLTLKGGGMIRERLLEMSDLGHHYSYAILEGPLAVKNYRATLRLRRISDGDRTLAEWSSSFDPDPPEKQAETEDFLSNAVFQGGFDALKKHFGG